MPTGKQHKRACHALPAAHAAQTSSRAASPRGQRGASAPALYELSVPWPSWPYCGQPADHSLPSHSHIVKSTPQPTLLHLDTRDCAGWGGVGGAAELACSVAAVWLCTAAQPALCSNGGTAAPAVCRTCAMRCPSSTASRAKSHRPATENSGRCAPRPCQGHQDTRCRAPAVCATRPNKLQQKQQQQQQALPSRSAGGSGAAPTSCGVSAMSSAPLSFFTLPVPSWP